MRFVLRTTLISFALLVSIEIHSSSAQVEDAHTFVWADWHLAGISEARADWNLAIEYYRNVLRESEILPLDVREWYRGTAYYGIARSAARIHNDTLVCRSLERAFSHHFWNFDLVASDSSLLSTCGRPWFDSLSHFWSQVLVNERAQWQSQPPIVFYPAGYDSTARWPLIVALHGGNANYQSFSEHWQNAANELHAVIAVPAGVFRESQITNSWGSDLATIEPSILELVSSFTKQHLADPSQIYVAGFSQGAQASIELALFRPDVFRGAIAMSGFVDRPIPDSVLQVAHRKGSRIYAITGQYEDPTFFHEIDSMHTSCTAAGIPFHWNIVPGMIHEVPLDFERQIADAWSWLRPSQKAVGDREE